MNSVQYYPNALESSDETFAGFAAGCALAGKAGCALVQDDNDTAADIQKRVQDLLDVSRTPLHRRKPILIDTCLQLAHDLTVAGADMSEVLTSAQARTNLYSIMYFPSAWATVAGIIRDWGLALDALAANQSVPGGIAAELSFLKPDLSSIPSYAYEAISCGDAVDAGNMTMRDGFDTIVFASETVSPLFGPVWGDAENACFAWPARAVERYTGPWDSKLKNPVLVIGNAVCS